MATATLLAPAPCVEGSVAEQVAGLARAYAESQALVFLLAHELRTRLKIAERALSSGGVDGLGSALQSTQEAQHLVDTVLELARGSDEEPGDPGEALDRVVRDLGEELGAAEVVAGRLPLVSLPQPLLEIVLRNLVSNALEAGAGTIEVFARGDDTICVRDDGCGVAPEEADRVFGAYSGKYGGAGLGLMLCREIIRGRGGEIGLELPSTFAFSAR